MRRFFVLFAGAALAAAPEPRGEPAALTVANESSATLECHAIAGHWYGFDLGDIAADGHAVIAVSYDRSSGMATMPNARGQPIPLEYMYCGRAGDAWRTRAILPMRERLAEPAPIVCREQSGALHCG